MTKELLYGLISWALLSASGCLTVGCQTQGHKKWSAEFFGQSIVIEDQVFANSDGKREYETGFTEAWTRPLVDWFTSAFAKDAPPVDTSGNVLISEKALAEMMAENNRRLKALEDKQPTP